MSTSLHDNPYGVGLAYRFSVHQEAMQNRDEIDLLEISTEDYIVRERRTYADPDERLLKEALATFPSVAHGLSLSIGTVGDLNETYLEGTKRFLADHGIATFSEHLAYHSVDGNDLTMFLPMPFEEISIQWLKQNYYAIRRELGRPFALENVTYHFPVPHGSLSEADYLRRLTEETDCTLLLDITNVYNNSQNHGYEAEEFLDRLPMDRITQMHLAGGHQLPDGTWEDSHSAPVMDAVWPLFEEVVRRAENANIVILERDSKLKPFDSVMNDLRKAREIFYRYRPATAPEKIADAPADQQVARDPMSDEFSDLRAYQRSMMARITDPDFQTAFRENPPAAVAKFGLTDDEWIRKIIDSDGKSMHHFAESWEYFRKEDEQIAKEYEQREWATWAKQLEGSW